jgi:hypothetical protein
MTQYSTGPTVNLDPAKKDNASPSPSQKCKEKTTSDPPDEVPGGWGRGAFWAAASTNNDGWSWDDELKYRIERCR